MFTDQEIQRLRAIHQADQDQAHAWRHDGALAPRSHYAKSERLSTRAIRITWAGIAAYVVGGTYSVFAMAGHLPLAPWAG